MSALLSATGRLQLSSTVKAVKAIGLPSSAVLLLLRWVVAGAKSAPAGTAASKLAVNDASQLKALMGFKAAVDGTDILKGEWTPSTGGCSWRKLQERRSCMEPNSVLCHIAHDVHGANFRVAD